MTHKEILTKAIEKAAGFDISIPHFAHPLQEYSWDDNKRYWYLGEITIPLFEIIYQHSFAKALWGEEVYATDGSTNRPILYKWQDKLINMVIADDPIAYLGENI